MFEKINLFIDGFGGVRNIICIILFVISFFIINIFIVKKIFRIVFAIFSGLFVILQIVSLFFTQSFIGYQFYVHCNINGVDGMVSLFIPQIIALLFFLTGLVILIYSSQNLYKKVVLSHLSYAYLNGIKVISVSIILISFFMIFSFSNFLSDTKSLLSIFHTNKTGTFEKTLQKYSILDYTTPGNIQCSKGNNIIVLSLESLERSYLDNKFISLTPNLQELKRKWNYYNIEENYGSNWTSGSLYTYLTGFPALFGGAGNSIFQSVYHSDISSISDVLKKAGYTTIYMNGNTNNSGIKEMLYVLHFDKVIDFRSTKTNGYESSYGLRDKDLFMLAKNEIKLQSSLNKSFAIFISTTDTHFPDGIYDSRMKEYVSPKKTNLEFMVCALDYLIGDLISFLGREKITENTTIFIFPDHLKMGDPSIFSNTGKRGLYLITNAEEKTIKIDSSKPLFQIDLPKIILNGAKVKHNLNFFTDYIHSIEKNSYIKNNIDEITEINTNGFLRSSQ